MTINDLKTFFEKKVFRHGEEVLKISKVGRDYFASIVRYTGYIDALTEEITVYHFTVRNESIEKLTPESVGIRSKNKCPKNILKTLTEAPNSTAKNWRELQCV